MCLSLISNVARTKNTSRAQGQRMDFSSHSGLYSHLDLPSAPSYSIRSTGLEHRFFLVYTPSFSLFIFWFCLKLFLKGTQNGGSAVGITYTFKSGHELVVDHDPPVKDQCLTSQQ